MRLDRAERRSVIGMAASVLLLHLVGWGVLAGVVAPRHYEIGSAGVFGLGLGLTAYLLGMRHAFDADHIAAIDNTTRKLLADRQDQPGASRPLSIGFFFSLGHSTIVFVLVVLLALGIRSLAGQLESDSSTLQQITGVVGTAVSGTFLIIIGILNLIVLLGIIGVFRQLRRGELDEAALEHQLQNRGAMNRLLAGATKAVRKPGQMYPVGVLFGLGFDTATEIGLLVLAGGVAAFALPWYAILTLPILFAAGMSVLDAADGIFMGLAYGWALSRPVRKIYFNIVVTGLSVAVALIIGGIEVISLLVDRLGITSGPLASIAQLDLGYVGFVIVGLFLATWVVALLVWRVGRIEERWSAPLGGQ